MSIVWKPYIDCVYYSCSSGYIHYHACRLQCGETETNAAWYMLFACVIYSEVLFIACCRLHMVFHGPLLSSLDYNTVAASS